MGNVFEDSFNDYFGKKTENVNMEIPESVKSYANQKVLNPRENVEQNNFTTGAYALTADGNIDTIEQLCKVLKEILNAAWGSDWGELSPDLKRGEDSSKIITPQIMVDINNREVAERMPIKPVLMQTQKDGDDSILIYRQWFDCVVEFDFYGRTSKETRDLHSKFETLISIYAGYLKRKGVSEILFLKEVSARNSLHFVEQTPMKCLMYFVRFEKITPIRQSLINKINTSVGIKAINEESIKLVIEANKQIVANNQDPTEIELDLFDQDTGVEYKDI